MDCSFAQALRRPYKEKRATWRTHVVVILVALLGGAFATVSSGLTESASGVLGPDNLGLEAARIGALVLLAIVVAPITEELFKPIGVYLALVKWPEALGNRLYRALLCAGGGLVFGILESFGYLYVVAADHTRNYELYRLTVPLAMHAVASYTVGLGLDRRIVGVVNRGDPLPKETRNFYVAGVAIHAIFNTTVAIIAVAGLVDFQ